MRKMEKSVKSSEEQKRLDRPSSAVWDCGSALYDSFELKSFKRQLDSAISARTLSMPHLPDRRSFPLPPPPPPQQQTQPQPKPATSSAAKKHSRISRSIQKLLRSVFKQKPSSAPAFGVGEGLYVSYDKSGALTTIPEAPEAEYLGKLSPEMDRFVRKTASERFAPSSIGISCA